MQSIKETYNENMARIDAILNAGGNPNHDKIGRFSGGSGGGKSGGKSKMSPEAMRQRDSRRRTFGVVSMKGGKSKVSLDYMDVSKHAKDAKKFGLTSKIKTMDGPGAGWPVVTFIGPAANIDKLLKSYES